MNSKILLAFIGGAALASGIVYMAVRPGQPPAPSPVVSTAMPKPSPVAVAPSPQPAAPEPQPAPPAKPSPVKAKEAESKPTPPPKQATPPPVQAAVYRPAPEPPRAEPPPEAPPPAPSTVNAAPAPAPRVKLPPPPQPHVVTIPAGALINVRLGEALSAKTNVPGDTFLATLDQPLVVDGFVIAERGARAEGRVVEADAGGRVKGGSRLGIELTTLNTSDGQRVKITTATFVKRVSPSYGQDAAKVGAGAAIGAVIGAIAGGGKGAGIGAGVGGAAGAGDVLLTRGKPATLPAETRISFRVENPVTITERAGQP